MALDTYRLAGAAGTGLMSGMVQGKAGMWTDLLVAVGLGAIGYLAALNMRGTAAAVGEGALDGAAGYIGSRIPFILGGYKKTSAPVGYTPVEVPVSYASPGSAGGISVVEI